MPHNIAERLRRFEKRKQVYLEDETDRVLQKRVQSRTRLTNKAARVAKLEQRLREYEQQRPIREAKLGYSRDTCKMGHVVKLCNKNSTTLALQYPENLLS